MAAKVYSGRELSAFCLQISILLKAAVPLDEGLYLMAEDAPTEEEKKLLHTMGEDVELGDPFFESLERTGAFPPYVVRMAKLGQQSGTLDQMMESLADYYEKEIGYRVPSRTPFVGKNFNVTRAGIHADGLLKNEEIYNVFDTDKFLNRPPLVAISNTSGLAGIAHWINTYFKLPDDKKVDKNSELVNAVKDWVDEQYEEGRVTVLTDDELIAVIDQNCKRLGIDLI
mgnify:CR=1 FL=1